VIDPKKLPAVAIVDAGVFIRSQGQLEDDPRSKICAEFWQAMIMGERTIYVPAPVVTEATRNRHYPPVPVPSVRFVEVAAFDHKAAIILSDKFSEQVLRTVLQSGPKDYIRYDAMIVACAARYGATMVTLDSDIVIMCAHANIPCKAPSDFSPDQTSLLDL
jgi:predicted nucleic acid-binding protein